MPTITINNKQNLDTVYVPAAFITKFMLEAHGEYIKVYLFLIYLMQKGLEFSVADIADALDCTERDIMRSLKYWQKKGILTLTYLDNALVGVDVLPLIGFIDEPAKTEEPAKAVISTEKASKNVPEKAQKTAPETVSETAPENAPETAYSMASSDSVSVTSDFNTPDSNDPLVQAVTPEDLENLTLSVDSFAVKNGRSKFAEKAQEPKKQSVSTAAVPADVKSLDVASYKTNDLYTNKDCIRMMETLESVKGKPITVTETQQILQILNMFGDCSIVLFLVRFCMDPENHTGNTGWSIRTFEKVALGWREKDLIRMEDIRRHLGDYFTQVYAILERKERYEELDRKIERWKNEYHYSPAIVKYARQLALENGRSGKAVITYVDTCLSNWFSLKLRTEDDIRRHNDEYVRSMSKNSVSSASPNSGNSFVSKNTAAPVRKTTLHNVEQRDYSDIDLDALARELTRKKQEKRIR